MYVMTFFSPFRPLCQDDGSIVAHHGPVTIHTPMAQSLMEIINWNAGRSSIEDLVILGMSHDDTACEKNVMTLLGQHNIKYIKD